MCIDTDKFQKELVQEFLQSHEFFKNKEHDHELLTFFVDSVSKFTTLAIAKYHNEIHNQKSV